MQETKSPNPIESDSIEIVPSIQKTSEFIEFAQWLATPHELRQIKTQKEFAASIGVCQDSLSDWKQHPKFWSFVHKFTIAWIQERVPDVINGLYRNACSKGKAKDVEMFLRIAGTKMD